MKHPKRPNDQEPIGDAQEPDAGADATFDPHELEEIAPDPGTNGQPPTQPAGSPGPENLDPFDPARLRLAQDFTASAGVREVLLSVKYGKPSKESFFRVHPSEEYRIQCGVIELKEDDSTTYWVDPSLWPAMADQPTFSPR